MPRLVAPEGREQDEAAPMRSRTEGRAQPSRISVSPDMAAASPAASRIVPAKSMGLCRSVSVSGRIARPARPRAAASSSVPT